MSIKYISVALLFGLIVGAGTVYRFYPRTQTVEKEVVRTDVKTVTVIQRPDGTLETVTTVDRSTRTEDKKSVAAPNPPNWLVTGGLGLNSEGQKAFSAGVHKRLFGPVFVGVQGITSPGNTTVLGTVTLEF